MLIVLFFSHVITLMDIPITTLTPSSPHVFFPVRIGHSSIPYAERSHECIISYMSIVNFK